MIDVTSPKSEQKGVGLVHGFWTVQVKGPETKDEASIRLQQLPTVGPAIQ